MNYFNLKENDELNELIYTESQIIWVPVIQFFNTKESITSVNDKHTSIKVGRRQNGTLIGSTVNEDIRVFEGSKNLLKMKRVYKVDFICTYDMRFYPFDIQICSIDMIMLDNAAMFVDFEVGKLIFSGEKDLSQYNVMDSKIKQEKIRNKSGLRVLIILGRKLLGNILTVYVPTALLVFICHCTNYFKDCYFDAVVSVNLT